MSDVVEFLVRMGRDAPLNRASHDALARELAGTALDQATQEAILAKDGFKLRNLLKIVPNAGYLIPGEEQEEEREEDEDGGEDPGREDDAERSARKFAGALD